MRPEPSEEEFWSGAGLNVHVFDIPPWWKVVVLMAAAPLVLAWVVLAGAWDSGLRRIRRR